MSRTLTVLGAFVCSMGVTTLAFAGPTAPAVGAFIPPAEVTSEPPEHEKSTPTLLGRKAQIGGYGGVDVAYTRMFGQDGALVGAQGALLINHRLSLGIAGYGWTNPQRGPANALGTERRFQTGYFGGTLRYSFLQHSPVYLTVGGLIGGGAIVLAPDEDEGDDDLDDDIDREDVDVYAVFQPDVTLHANLTHWMRVGLTGGYRFTAGVDRFGFSDSDANGVVVGAHVQFGRF